VPKVDEHLILRALRNYPPVHKPVRRRLQSYDAPPRKKTAGSGEQRQPWQGKAK
jgi:endonuclease YncB( thermonuclease family)